MPCECVRIYGLHLYTTDSFPLVGGKPGIARILVILSFGTIEEGNLYRKTVFYLHPTRVVCLFPRRLTLVQRSTPY
uniref:hypothetical protein n=1 Tax=Cephaloticoccus sp. TaxID=1985742 RepID=UPI00404ABD03